MAKQTKLHNLTSVTVAFNPEAGTVAGVISNQFGSHAETRHTTVAGAPNDVRIPVAVALAASITATINNGVAFTLVGYEMAGFNTFRIIFRQPAKRGKAK
jgi:hypothetical protein